MFSFKIYKLDLDCWNIAWHDDMYMWHLMTMATLLYIACGR